MLAELKFVQGAVSRKDLLPEMTHFSIVDGRITSYNGVLALSSPIDFGIDCYPKAEALIKAIASCTDVTTLSMTPAGRLRVESGKFRSFVPCLVDVSYDITPEGEEVGLDGEAFLKGLKIVARFIGNDASRPWSNGVLLKDQSFFATNNVSLVQYWLGINFPSVVNIPMAAVREVLRINRAPTHVQLTDRSITFHYESGEWIRSQLLATDWPTFSHLLDVPSNPVPIEDELFTAIRVLKGSEDELRRIYIKENQFYTHKEINESGACYTADISMPEGCFSGTVLELLEGVGEVADFTKWPAPIPFFGPNLRGVLMGMLVG